MKKTIVTSDGYTFFVTDDGRVVDNQNPGSIDLAWKSLPEFISDSDGFFDLTVDFGEGRYAKFEIVNEPKICRGVDGFDISVWTYSDTDSGDTSPFNYVSDLKTSADVAEWIVGELTEMGEAKSNGDWDAICLGEEI